MRYFLIFVVLTNINHANKTSFYHLKYTQPAVATLPCGNVGKPSVWPGCFIMKQETWLPIIDYPLYLVSDMGRVKRIAHSINVFPKTKLPYTKIREDKILSIESLRMGYPIVGIQNSNGAKIESVHRLVAKAFIPNPENKPQVNHIDNNPKNNHASNLEWCTGSENIQHCHNQDRHPSATSTEKVKECTDLWETGLYTIKEISKISNINYGTLTHILYRESDFKKFKK